MTFHVSRAARAAAFAAATAIGAAGLVSVAPSRAPAQDVALVKVDVALMATGYRVSKLLSSNVVNDKNEKVGSIDDIVLNHDKALAAVLQVGGFLGIGSRLVAVPYDNLQIDEKDHKIVLPGATRDELKKMAEFKYQGS
jgi:sporulation protein YlmC with PRC-barrel domain